MSRNVSIWLIFFKAYVSFTLCVILNNLLQFVEISFYRLDMEILKTKQKLPRPNCHVRCLKNQNEIIATMRVVEVHTMFCSSFCQKMHQTYAIASSAVQVPFCLNKGVPWLDIKYGW